MATTIAETQCVQCQNPGCNFSTLNTNVSTLFVHVIRSLDLFFSPTRVCVTVAILRQTIDQGSQFSPQEEHAYRHGVHGLQSLTSSSR